MENFEFKTNSTLTFKGFIKYQVENEKNVFIHYESFEFKKLKYVLIWNSLQDVLLIFFNKPVAEQYIKYGSGCSKTIY